MGHFRVSFLNSFLLSFLARRDSTKSFLRFWTKQNKFLIKKFLIKKKACIQKNGKCYRVKIVAGNGLLLDPHGGWVAAGDGLYLKRENNVYDGEGLLLGRDSPFKNIPILGWLI